ncbi:hypothetical protein M569_03970 [Genlisea aurea]|uniref:Uncharacterized protein n=1 Tax=Genlisea aurea TaxID=192259 RepID=S8E4T3_9LAMI|nr:hypothetical protein M569_03970 [Genlisea aurea]
MEFIRLSGIDPKVMKLRRRQGEEVKSAEMDRSMRTMTTSTSICKECFLDPTRYRLPVSLI